MESRSPDGAQRRNSQRGTARRLREEVAELRRQLGEAEDALRAIREGRVDAIVVDGEGGPQVFSLSGAETVYRLAVETMAEAALNVTAEGRILFCNERFSAFVKAPMHRLLGRDLTEFVEFPPEPGFRALLGTCRKAPVRERVVFRAADGSLTATHLTGRALHQGSEVTLCLVAADLTELERSASQVDRLREDKRALEEAEARQRAGRLSALTQAEQAVWAQQRAEQAAASLRESEARYRLLFEKNPDGVFSLDAEGRFSLANAACEKITGYSRAELAAMKLLDLCAPEGAAATAARLRRSFRKPAYAEWESAFVRKDGSRVEVWLASEPGRGEGGVEALHCTVKDISDRKRAEAAMKESLAEKEVLLKEIHHRVKNNMQVLSSLVSLQADAASDPHLGAAFADIRDRVRSMALVHEKLYHSGNLAEVDFSAYARSLLEYLWHAHCSETDVTLEVSVEPLNLTIERAVPCGLILNELAGNTLKHAFAGRQRGKVAVSGRLANNGRVSLSVSDDGVGLPGGFEWREARSLGLRLVQMLAKQLDGSVEARSRAGGGTEFEVLFPGEAER